jgi:hypothetical protein
MTANMQTITVRAAAQLMNVSERSVHKARELMICDRPDLVRTVEESRLTIHVALKIAKPEKHAKPRGGLAALKDSRWRDLKATDWVELKCFNDECSSARVTVMETVPTTVQASARVWNCSIACAELSITGCSNPLSWRANANLMTDMSGATPSPIQTGRRGDSAAFFVWGGGLAIGEAPKNHDCCPRRCPEGLGVSAGLSRSSVSI